MRITGKLVNDRLIYDDKALNAMFGWGDSKTSNSSAIKGPSGGNAGDVTTSDTTLRMLQTFDGEVRDLPLEHHPIRDTIIMAGVIVFAVKVVPIAASALDKWLFPPIPLPPSGYHKPPGWNDGWDWRYPEANSPNAEPRWFDQGGGEWRWHAPDQWHDIGHWDYNPWGHATDQWQNLYPPFK